MPNQKQSQRLFQIAIAWGLLWTAADATAQAQDAATREILRENPQLQNLPGLILQQEMDRGRQMWRELNYTLYPYMTMPSEEELIQYRGRNCEWVSEEQFLQEARPAVPIHTLP